MGVYEDDKAGGGEKTGGPVKSEEGPIKSEEGPTTPGGGVKKVRRA
jgi:hypothetical protein